MELVVQGGDFEWLGGGWSREIVGIRGKESEGEEQTEEDEEEEDDGENGGGFSFVVSEIRGLFGSDEEILR